MDRFVNAVTSYPTAVLSVLLIVVVVYWFMALLGWVDFESSGLDFDVDLQADGDPGELPTLAGYAVALGLNGVPFSIVVTLLVIIAWTLSALAGEWLMPLVPTALLRFVAGTGVLLGSAILALPLTAWLLRPLRGLFVTHQAMGNSAIVGQSCLILSESVDARHGRAEVAQRGASLQIRVWTEQPGSLRKGDTAHILEYDAAAQRYLVQAVRL